MGACRNQGFGHNTYQESGGVGHVHTNSSALLTSPSHVRFVVLKQGHAGSLWLHSLLNAQPGVLSFFEFDGCDKASDSDGGGGGGGGGGDGGDGDSDGDGDGDGRRDTAKRN